MILHTDITNNKVKSGLYIVSTPIGNLSDITLRALEVLKKSDYILCEDTRTSKNLLDRYEIKSKLISNHKFNEKKNLSKIIQILKSDCVVSLISDAGTPSVSDPGAILVNECLINKIDIYPIPGASAVSSAVSISGFNEQYFFYGFFPEKKTSKLSIALSPISILVLLVELPRCGSRKRLSSFKYSSFIFGSPLYTSSPSAKIFPLFIAWIIALSSMMSPLAALATTALSGKNLIVSSLSKFVVSAVAGQLMDKNSLSAKRDLASL